MRQVNNEAPREKDIDFSYNSYDDINDDKDSIPELEPVREEQMFGALVPWRQNQPEQKITLKMFQLMKCNMKHHVDATRHHLTSELDFGLSDLSISGVDSSEDSGRRFFSIYYLKTLTN